MLAPGQIRGWELIWGTWGEPQQHPRHAAPLPDTWGLAAWPQLEFHWKNSWDFLTLLSQGGTGLPRTLEHVSGALPCHLLSCHWEIFTKDGQLLLDIFLTTTTRPKEKDVKITMLKIAKASPPQAGGQWRSARTMVALCNLILGPMSVQLACSFSPWSPASLGAQTAAVEGLSSKAWGQRRLFPVELCSFFGEDGKSVTVDMEPERKHCLTEKTPKFCLRELGFLLACSVGSHYTWGISWTSLHQAFVGNHWLCVLSLLSAHLEIKGLQWQKSVRVLLWSSTHWANTLVPGQLKGGVRSSSFFPSGELGLRNAGVAVSTSAC